MGSQIIRQPDGRLAIFSTVSESLVAVDLDDEQVVAWFIGEAVERAEHDARRMINRVRDPENRRPYHQFTLTYDEAVRMHRQTGRRHAE